MSKERYANYEADLRELQFEISQNEKRGAGR